MKVLFCRFQEFSGLVNTFNTEGLLETRPFTHWSKHVFQSELKEYKLKRVKLKT